MQYVEPSLRHIRNAAQYYSDVAYRMKYVHEKFTPEQIAQAIRRTKGGIAASARLLRCAKTTVQRYLALYPDLKQVAEDEVGLMLDVVEETLFHDAMHGDPEARRFVLLTRGRSRGYVLRREVTTTNGAPVGCGETHQTIIMIDGSKEQYLDGLRQMREYARAMQSAPPVMPDALPAGGQGNGGGDAG